MDLRSEGVRSGKTRRDDAEQPVGRSASALDCRDGSIPRARQDVHSGLGADKLTRPAKTVNGPQEVGSHGLGPLIKSSSQCRPHAAQKLMQEERDGKRHGVSRIGPGGDTPGRGECAVHLLILCQSCFHLLGGFFFVFFFNSDSILFFLWGTGACTAAHGPAGNILCNWRALRKDQVQS